MKRLLILLLLFLSLDAQVIIEYHKNGNIKSKVNYNDGKKEGLALSYYEDGSLMSKSNFVNDISQGAGKIYFPNGVIEELNFLDGKVHGEVKTYSKNHLYRVTNFRHGEPEGNETYYDSKGNKFLIITYGNQTLISPVLVFEEGKNYLLDFSKGNYFDAFEVDASGKRASVDCHFVINILERHHVSDFNCSDNTTKTPFTKSQK